MFKGILISVVAAFYLSLVGGVALISAPEPVYAQTFEDQARQGVNSAGGGNQRALGPAIKRVVNILLFVVGAVAVIMIVIGGLRYVLSGGDSQSVTNARNSILYAVVGLVIALLAYAIVNFVLDNILR